MSRLFRIQIRVVRQAILLLTVFTVFIIGSPGYAQEISDQLKEKISTYQAERETIQQEVKDLVAAMPDATLEEKQAVILSWKAENEERIATQQELASEVKTALREVIEQKKEELSDLTPEEQKIAMQAWFAENSEYLTSSGNGSRSMQKAKEHFQANAGKMMEKQKGKATGDSNWEKHQKGQSGGQTKNKGNSGHGLKPQES